LRLVVQWCASAPRCSERGHDQADFIQTFPRNKFSDFRIAPQERFTSIKAVAERMISARREQAIIRLLDDDSPVVREAVAVELEQMGGHGVALLRNVIRGGNRILTSYAREYLEDLQGPDTVTEFIRFIRSMNYELETGFLMLNRTIYPDFDSAESCMQLDAIAARCRELIVQPISTIEKCRVINRVLFHEYGFSADTENMDDPRNSFLCELLSRRRGIPISLSILYISVAQRCNLLLEPVGMPGRFMVGCFTEEEPFFIDAFEKGAFRSVDELMNVLRKNKLNAHPSHLSPSSVSEVLCRCCRNLSHQFTSQNLPEQARLFSGFVHEFEAAYRRYANP